MIGKVVSKEKNQKGFTLAELLIVVAIIAVLVAIAIPVFSSQLEKSREATDFANVRAAYAEVMSAAITDDDKSPLKQSDGSFQMMVSLKQTQDGWTTDIEGMDIGGIPAEDWIEIPRANGSCSVTYSPDTDSVTINWSGTGVAGGGSAGGNSNVVTLPDYFPKQPGTLAEATPIGGSLINEYGKAFYEDGSGQKLAPEPGKVYSLNSEDLYTVLDGKWYRWFPAFAGRPGHWGPETSGDSYYWNEAENTWMKR